jgi:ribosomal protein L29
MKKKDLTDLRNKKINELEKLLSKKRNELINTYAKIKAGQEKNLKKAKNIRRDVAQILTIIREKGCVNQNG